MKQYLQLSILSGALLLAACSPQTNGGHSLNSGNEPNAMQHGAQLGKKGDRNLTVTQETPTTPNELAFSIHEDGAIFSDYGISHTKEMHFIVVRDDLQHFQHLHPTRDAQGVWHVDFKPEAGGHYWLYADFVDSKKDTYTLRYEQDFPGAKGQYGTTKNFEKVKNVDGYRIELQPAVAGAETSFNYRITDAQENLVQVEPYLGARGHSVIISPSADFIHAHASDEGELPVFITSLPSGFYRMFTQFQIKGKVITVDFDWFAGESH